MKSLKWILLCLLLSRGALAEDISGALKSAKFRGGAIVHLGCRDGVRTAGLAAVKNAVVQGLDTSPTNVAAAREHLASKHLYGRATALLLETDALPYVDNTVNLLVVDNISGVSKQEMLRVLAPGGSICTATNGKWSVENKPRPDSLDDWTHYQHDPAGTMVGKDTEVGLPRRMQWVGGPKWLRNHEFMASLHAMVSTGGRIFCIIDEGLRNHIFLPPRWTLISRDAFNGTVLWKRSIKSWRDHLWPMKSGPGDMPRRLVAVGDRVYLTLGFIAPLTAIDAATGKTVRSYEQTKAAEEILVSDGVLYLVTDPDKKPVAYREKILSWGQAKKRANTQWGWTSDRPKRIVMAVHADSGKVLWKYRTNIAPQTLTVGDKRIFLFNGSSLVALDRTSGKQAWVSDDIGLKILPETGYTPRMVFSDGVVLLCHTRGVHAFSAAKGKALWKSKLKGTGHNCPNDIFVVKGLVWSAGTGKAQSKGTEVMALDLHTGETKHDFVATNPDVYFMHQRCYPGRATERFLITSGTGSEFYELGSKRLDINHHIRGSCIYGVMPCNGLLYKPPDSCACHYQSKLTDLCALAPAATKKPAPLDDNTRLVKGPAYRAKTSVAAGGRDSWPMYRRDTERSGHTPKTLPPSLKEVWKADIGGKLTAMSIAEGKAFLAAVDRHTLYALHADSGKVAWRFTAGGRIDSPPTIQGGRAIFGSADGWVYCLQAADGAMMWRYRVAIGRRQIVSYQQFESIWPLHGSVLVRDNKVYCLAGRNMLVDGGMRLVCLDAKTGNRISATSLNELLPGTSKNLQTNMPGKAMPVANPDILSCDGKYVYMGAQKFDLAGKRIDVEVKSGKERDQAGAGRHLFCPTGFLDDAWFHRSYWIYGKNGGEGHNEYAVPPNCTNVGRIMVFDKSLVYSFRATNYANTMHPRTGHYMLAAARQLGAPSKDASPPAAKPRKRKGKDKAAKKAKPRSRLKIAWQGPKSTMLACAMALAGETLLAAGPPDLADEEKMFGFLSGADDDINRQLRSQDAAWRGKYGALLRTISAADGKQINEYKLAALPVWDGMAVAGGKVFIALKNGKVVCFEGVDKQPPGP